jgi:two-component system response regulator PilR (NtrC family)
MHILLVDGHGDSADVYERLLARQGYLVTRAGSFADARRALNNRAFDLLLCDTCLPDGDGHALMRDIAAPRGILGIAMTTQASPRDLQMSCVAGFAAHLLKPIDLHELLRTIDAVVERASNDPRTPPPGPFSSPSGPA